MREVWALLMHSNSGKVVHLNFSGKMDQRTTKPGDHMCDRVVHDL